MSRLLRISFVLFFLSACKGNGDGQWNLNKSIGWESTMADDYSVVFLKLNGAAADSNTLFDKSVLDNKILEVLRKNRLGDQVDNDKKDETDKHFLLSKDNKVSLQAMVSIVNEFDRRDCVTFYRRDYDSLGKWIDQVIMQK